MTELVLYFHFIHIRTLVNCNFPSATTVSNCSAREKVIVVHRVHIMIFLTAFVIVIESSLDKLLSTCTEMRRISGGTL